MNILDAMHDANLFAAWFKRPESWSAWRVFLRALFALPMTAKQRDLFTQCTGRTEAPTQTAKEAWLICGRRSGKSFVLSLCAVFLACFHDHRKHLAPGERGTIMIVASDRKQCRIILRYIRALLMQVPMLAQLIEREGAEFFDLRGRVSIEVHTASYRSTRGYTIVAALLDELAFWPTDDAANPDTEIIAALRPSMATIPNAMLLCASSPYAKRGALHDAHKRHFGKTGPVLVWQAETRTMNPTVPQSIIEEAMQLDPANARAEWMAEFRDDVSGFVDYQAVLDCVEKNVRERPRQLGVKYFSFVDPSGGASDSMTAAIGHLQGNTVIVDCIREIPAPFDPESVVTEFVKLFRAYGVGRTHGDRYAAQWTATAFEKRRIEYRHSELNKSSLYLNLLPHINARTIRLLDHPRSINQIASLERHTARGGRESIDHPSQGRDDLANSIAGLTFIATNQRAAPMAATCSFAELAGDFSATRSQPSRWSAPCTLNFDPPAPSHAGGFTNLTSWK